MAYYNADGSLDTSFSGDGKLTFNFDGNPSSANSIGIDSLGRIVLGGTSGPTIGNNSSFAVARLYTLDPVPVTITGRTLTQNGQPVRGVNITITGPSGQSFQTTTSSLGYYQFQVMSGQTYTLTPSLKRYRFQPKVVAANESIADLDFIGQSSQDGLAAAKSAPKRETADLPRGKN